MRTLYQPEEPNPTQQPMEGRKVKIVEAKIKSRLGRLIVEVRDNKKGI